MNRVLMVFRNETDRDYDKFIFAPEGMSMVIADLVVSAVVAKCPDNDWDGIEDELVKLGFKAIEAWSHSGVAL